MSFDINLKSPYKGFWWTPEKPEEKMPGELEMDSDGNLVLTVVLERDNLYSNVANRNYVIPVINGHARNWGTSKDLAFTLFENSISGYHKSGLSKYTIHCKFASTLKHYKNLNSLRIGSAFLKFQLLNDWIEIHGIKGVKPKTKRKYNISLNYIQPAPITIFKNKDFHIYIWFMTSTHGGKRDFKLDEFPLINIEFKKNKSFDEFWVVYQTIKSFFSFCISLPITSLQIRFQQHTDSELRKLAHTHQSTMNLFVSDAKTYTKTDSLPSNLMLVDYKKIEGNEIQFLNKWFSLTKELEPVLKLYFDTLYNPDLYIENVLLNYVSALETFHKIRNPDFDAKSQTYSKKLDEILERIKLKNDRDWLSSRLKRKKEAKLLDRLIDIANKTPMISSKLLDDSNEFCLALSKTRNYYTHPNARKKDLPDEKGMIKMSDKARVLLQTQILLDLGFNETDAYSLLIKAISNWSVWRDD